MGSYGSTGINAAQDVNLTESSLVAVTKISQSDSDQNTDANQEKNRERTNDRAQNETPLSQSRQIISARQIQKLAKNDQPIFLAIIRRTNDAPRKRSNKRSSDRVAKFAATHRMTEVGSGQLIKTLTQRKILLQLLNENIKFSTVSLYVTGKI